MVRIKVLKILDLKLGDNHAKEQFEYCFEHNLLNRSKGLGTSSNNLLVPLLKLLQSNFDYYKNIEYSWRVFQDRLALKLNRYFTN